MGFSATTEVLPVGDGRRRTLGRAVVAVLAASLVFYADIWFSKEIPALYAHTAWRDDPYDALISFMFVAVPLLVCLSAVRLRLCRRLEPLPVRRALDLLQVCRLLCAAMGLTLAGEWVSVAAAGHGATAGSASSGLLAVLILMSMVMVAVTVHLRKVQRTTWAQGQAPAEPDWLADAVTLLERESSRLGRPGEGMARAVRWIDGSVITQVRRHPLWATGVFALVLSLFGDSPQIVLEGYRPALAVWFVAVSSCSVFAFVVIAGRYLHLVERPRRRSTPLVYAIVVISVCVPLVASFRGSLWWMLGAQDSTAGLAQLAELTAVIPLAAGVVTYVVAGLISRRGRTALSR
jgi:hypothetical protein